ncbi:uncharacterized protein A4U43_C03F20660 [Asparagus officinalis]|uniref:Uncharacterized protein n=1 Tax=Asparagus officinalis TaxID=4686 RepID=A0A5P1FBP6_ASPOF|nr:uncharacterized protein A4U43_C03F20660 [Asparagus officinalis]
MQEGGLLLLYLAEFKSCEKRKKQLINLWSSTSVGGRQQPCNLKGTRVHLVGWKHSLKFESRLFFQKCVHCCVRASRRIWHAVVIVVVMMLMAEFFEMGQFIPEI